MPQGALLIRHAFISLNLRIRTGPHLSFNKWDGMSEYERERVKQTIDRRLGFVNFARRYHISALHGTGVGDLYHAIDEPIARRSSIYPLRN